MKGIGSRQNSSTDFVFDSLGLLSGYKEDVIQTITNESPARKRGERRKCEKKVKGRKIYPKIPISLLLFLFFSSDLLSKRELLLLLLLLFPSSSHGLQGETKMRMS